MEWADVGRVVAKAAPVLGSVLGGPVGAIAGAAGSLIASALGCEPDPEAVQRTIAQSPDLLLKLRDLEIQQQAQLLQWQRDQVQAELTDRMSARDREVEPALCSSVRWRRPSGLWCSTTSAPVSEARQKTHTLKKCREVAGDA